MNDIETQKKGTCKGVIIFLVVLILVLIGVIVFLFIDKDECKTVDNSNSESTSNKNDTSNSDKTIKEFSITGLIDELAEAYKKGEGEYPSWKGLTETDGLIYSNINSPHMYVQISIPSSHFELFYKVKEEWIYYGGSQDLFECAKFDTDELKKSFEGLSCYDTDGDIKVVH